jgi:alpha-ribazole phosphatase CobZ
VGKGGSTINIFVLVERALSLRALAELLSLVSGSKALALSDLCLSCSPSSRAFQSAVDATAVATLEEPPQEEFVGPVTPIGSKVSELVYEVVIDGINAALNVEERVEGLIGLPLDTITSLALKVYAKAPVPGVNEEEVRSLVSSELRSLLKDPNLWLLLSSYRCPEVLASLGWVPGLSREEYRSDSPKIVSDEVLGMGISLYINGIRGLLAYYWVDRIKDDIKGLGDLPPMLDDVVSSLIGGVLSRVYDRLLRGS